MADEDPIIGTAEAADILHWHRRKVQRVLKKAATTNTLPITIVQVGDRGEYVLHASDVTDIVALAENHH